MAWDYSYLLIASRDNERYFVLFCFWVVRLPPPPLVRKKGKTVVQTGFGFQREVTGEEVNKCVAKLNTRKAAGADELVNEFMQYGEEGMLTVMVVLYIWIWKKRVRV